MTNHPKARGTAAETALVRWARERGFGGADRQPLRGNRDAGDVALCPGVIVEVKAHATAATGQPGEKQLAGWLAQTEAERVNARAAHALLVVRRKGTTDVGRWWCYQPTGQVVDLLGADLSPVPDGWVCMTVASACAMLRAAGYGDDLGVAS